MSFAVVWLELSACALLWVAATAAWGARLRRPAPRWIATGAAALLPTSVAVAATLLAHFLLDEWSPALIVLAVVVAIGSIAIERRALRRLGGSVACRLWPAETLTGWFALAIFLHAITMWHLDKAALERQVAIRSDAAALALSVAPERVPEEENAAPAYYLAFDLMPKDENNSIVPWIEALHRPHDSVDWLDSELSEYLERRRESLAWVHEAAGRARCFFLREYGRPSFSQTLEETSRLRSIGQLLAMDARRQVALGNWDAAIQDVRSLYAVSRHVGQEPFVVSQFIAGLIEVSALKTLELVLAAYPDASRNSELVRVIDPTVSYRRQMSAALQMEEALGLSLFSDFAVELQSEEVVFLASDAPPDERQRFDVWSSLAYPLKTYYRTFRLSADIVAYQREMEFYRDLAQRPYSQIKNNPVLKAEARASRTLKNNGELQLHGLTKPGLITGIVLPSDFAKLASQATRFDACRRLATLLLAAARYRIEHGVYPDDAATAASYDPRVVMLDPFDDQPFRLLKKGEGVVLYSIGPNDKDDGGAIDLDDPTQGDIAVSLGVIPAVGR